jgi:hypothetical protein
VNNAQNSGETAASRVRGGPFKIVAITPTAVTMNASVTG